MSNFIKGFEIDEWNVHNFNIGGKTTGKVATTKPPEKWRQHALFAQNQEKKRRINAPQRS